MVEDWHHRITCMRKRTRPLHLLFALEKRENIWKISSHFEIKSIRYRATDCISSLHCYTHFKRRGRLLPLHKNWFSHKNSEIFIQTHTWAADFWFIGKFLLAHSIQCGLFLFWYTGFSELSLKCLVVCVCVQKPNVCVKVIRSFASIQQQRHTWHVWYTTRNIPLQHFYTRKRAARSFSIHFHLYIVYILLRVYLALVSQKCWELWKEIWKYVCMELTAALKWQN